MCSEPFADSPAYLMHGGRWANRRWKKALLLICEDCYDSRKALGNTDHRKYPVWVLDMVGRGFNVMPPTPCVACGQLVIRLDDPLLKRVTCSHSCSTSLTRSRNGNLGTDRPCPECGDRIDTGRADSVYCSNACRQRAYRRRRG
ncbi:hypothetical protein ADL12_32150 [Streptomyces regalis]|uniref:Uncharacterized protein n=1 Tax=Streptomyces regalis TaxID=68262 RepID=A0A101JGZ6_9ACTN|nr:hypothetical protein ADL12_32150 [Streptomyces regalis]